MKTHIAKSLVYIKTKPGRVLKREVLATAASDYGFGLRTLDLFTGDWETIGDKQG